MCMMSVVLMGVFKLIVVVVMMEVSLLVVKKMKKKNLNWFFNCCVRKVMLMLISKVFKMFVGNMSLVIVVRGNVVWVCFSFFCSFVNNFV